MLRQKVRRLEWLNNGADTLKEKQTRKKDYVARNACDYQEASQGVSTVQMLGHSLKAVVLPKGDTLTYDFETSENGDRLLQIALIPTQPNDDGDLRFSVSVDGARPTEFSLKEALRSERWKLNVLRGQTVRSLKLKDLRVGKHKLVIKAIDDHLIVDQWMIDSIMNRKFYLFPVDGQ